MISRWLVALAAGTTQCLPVLPHVWSVWRAMWDASVATDTAQVQSLLSIHNRGNVQQQLGLISGYL